MFTFLLLILSVTLFTLVPLLVTIAYFTLAERKVMAGVQRRKGPDVVGFWGLLQPLADGLKLLVKERIMPSKPNRFLFVLSPVLTLAFSFIGWLALPITASSALITGAPTLLLILSILSCGAYGILLAG
jgi:NADH-quinone oxidoreductase subunit H